MIWIASFPRSGNTFFRNVLHEVYGMASSTYHLDKSRKVDDNFADYPFVKTHLLPKDLPSGLRGQPAVYLVRDARDSLVSLAHHRKDLVVPGSDYYNNLIDAIIARNGSFFGGWSRNVDEWTQKADIVIRFEDLVADPIREIEKLRAITDLPEPDLTKLPTFKDLKFGKPRYGGGKRFQRNQHHFRRGKVGGWKDELPRELERLLWAIHGKTILRMGYKASDFPTHGRPLRINIEISKIKDARHDGVRRYLWELLIGLRHMVAYFADLDVRFHDHSGIFKLNRLDDITTKVAPPDSFRNILNNPNLLRYEKGLLLLKIGVKRILPSNIYGPLAEFYRAGPLRELLYMVRKPFSKAGNRYDKGTIRELEAADLVHFPLPQQVNLATGLKGNKLVTVHDLSHRTHSAFHEPVNIDMAEMGMQTAQAENAHYLAVSQATATAIQTEYDVPPDRINVVHEGVHHNFFRPLSHGREKKLKVIRRRYGIPSGPYLMTLSTIEPRKNLGGVVRAFLRMKEKHPELIDTNLVISGHKGWKTKDIFTGIDLDRPDIIFTGFVAEDDLPYLYADARCLAYVSHCEGFGLPILEAMSCGTPVVYGDNSSMPEVGGEGGIAVDANDVAAIADAFHRLLTDEDFHRQKSEAAIQQAQKFSWQKMALQTIELYYQLAGKP